MERKSLVIACIITFTVVVFADIHENVETIDNSGTVTRIYVPPPNCDSSSDKDSCTDYCFCRWCHDTNKCLFFDKIGEKCKNHTEETGTCKRSNKVVTWISNIFTGIMAFLIFAALVAGCLALSSLCGMMAFAILKGFYYIILGCFDTDNIPRFVTEETPLVNIKGSYTNPINMA